MGISGNLRIFILFYDTKKEKISETEDLRDRFFLYKVLF